MPKKQQLGAADIWSSPNLPPPSASYSRHPATAVPSQTFVGDALRFIVVMLALGFAFFAFDAVMLARRGAGAGCAKAAGRS